MKIIVLRDAQGADYCDSCGACSDNKVSVYSNIVELISSLDEIDKATLHSLGWRNIKEIKEVEEKKLLDNEFYLINGFYRPIDLGSLSETSVDEIIKQHSVIAQRVNPESVMNDEQKAAYRKTKKKLEEQAKKAKETAQKRKQARIKSDIEKAKRILAKHRCLDDIQKNEVSTTKEET